jgi:hypothetical protein
MMIYGDTTRFDPLPGLPLTDAAKFAHFAA